MALFDKINDFAKAAGEKTASLAKAATEKTESVIETGKLNSKINAEERNISAITLKIGEYYIAKLDSGEILDGDVMNMFEGIKNCRSNIEGFRREIEAINAPKDAAPCTCTAEEGSGCKCEEPAKEKCSCCCDKPEEPTGEPVVLPLVNEEGPVCGCCEGAAEQSERLCPLCGATVEPDAHFCPLCGAQL